jgi:hypothetical protein
MQLTPHRTSSQGDKGDTSVIFPRLECWNSIDKVATVAADVNKKRVLCRISLEVLKERCGATEDDPMQSVTQHRVAIQDAARRLIGNKTYEEDGSIIIRAQNL